MRYISNVSTESVNLSARAGALSVAARRAFWLKIWPGDFASKLKLCNLLFSWDLLFGPGLDAALERTMDRKKDFPAEKRK